MSNATIIIVLSTITTGIMLGAIFSLVAVGVTIVYGSIWMPNAANGQFFLLAALFAWSASVTWGLHPAAAALLVIGISVPFSYLLEILLVRRFYDVPNRNVSYFVLTLGITQVLAGIFSVTYGVWSDQFQLPPIVKGVTFLGPFPIANNRLAAMLIAALLLAALFSLLRYHRYGRALRAVFQTREAAALRGVNVRAVYRMSFILGNGVIFAGGVLFAWTGSVSWGLHPAAAALLVIGISVPFSYLLEILLVRRFYDVPNRNVSYFVLTLGITQVLAGIFSVTYGVWSDQFQLPPIVKGVTFLGPFPIANNRLAAMLIAALLLTALFALLRYHRYGRALRAVFQNREAAALRGVNVRAVYRMSFILGNGVIFAGGVLFAFAYAVDLTVAWTMSVTALDRKRHV